jgi:hypothetical protein
MVRSADDLQQTPGFLFAERTRLADPHDVPNLSFVALIVGLEFVSPMHSLLVKRMLDEVLNSDDYGFLHLVADDSSRLRFDFARHLFLPLTFRQYCLDSSNLPPGGEQLSCVVGLPRSQTKSDVRELAAGLVEALPQRGSFESPEVC